MLDETTAPTLFRSGREDRTIPLFLGILLLVSLPVWWWVSGPFLWPWGLAASGLAGAGAGLAFFRWRAARETVAWREEAGLLEFRRGGRIRTLAVADLTRVRVCPSVVRTRLATGSGVWTLSHRLVRVEALLDRLRSNRPDLFPEPGEQVRFRVSPVPFLFTLALAGGAALTGTLVLTWGLWAGAVFGTGAILILGRALLFLPRAFTVSAGVLTISYGLRTKTLGRARTVREDAYAAGGAVFFRLRLGYGSRTVVLDEGHLSEPLRPLAGWIIHRLAF